MKSIQLTLGIALVVALASCSKPPSSDAALKILQKRIDKNANKCIRIVNVEKTNGVERDRKGTKNYELDCKATFEMMEDCYWEIDDEQFAVRKGPLDTGYMVNSKHEIIVDPAAMKNLELQSKRQWRGALPWPGFVGAGPSGRYYWHKGDRADIEHLWFSFEKTEKGWRYHNGDIY